MDADSHLILVLNPTAGKGRAGRELVHLRRLFAEREQRLEIFVTSAPGDAERLVSGLPLKPESVVVAAGGDGTVHEVGKALLNKEHGSLGVLPLGSGNDYAALMGVPAEVEVALEELRRGVTVQWDVGQIGPYVFLNTVGFGFSAAVSYFSRQRSPLRGMARYGGAIARAWWTHRPTILQLDGLAASGRHAATLMEIGIGNRCGGGFHLTARADPADGLLDVCLVSQLGRWEMPFLLPRGISGKHLGHRKVIYEQVPSFRLICEHEMMMHVDGELRVLPKGEHVVRNRSRALRVRLPIRPARVDVA